MDIMGTKAKIWANEHQSQNGTFYTYNVSISRKNEDGTFTRKSLPVRFKRGEAPGRTVDIENFKGFLTVDTYSNKEGNPMSQVVAVITEFKIADTKETEQITNAPQSAPQSTTKTTWPTYTPGMEKDAEIIQELPF